MQYLDATKIADFQKCPQLYDYKHNQGWRQKGESIDLTFGLLLGGALETFEKALLDGKAHDDAHAQALEEILKGAVNPDGTHKFGQTVGTWRCSGTTAYRNEKGNAAKCPYSHKGRYFPAPSPEVCSCGSGVVDVALWVPTKASKDITTLVELFVGYSDAARSRALIPTKLDGKAAIEHFWEIPFYNEYLMLKPVILCGNLDAVKSFGTENYIVDYKTTAKSLDARYWAGFTPNVQVDLYNMAAKHALAGIDIRGVAIEAFSTGSTATSFKLFQATDEQNEEMAQDTAYWIGTMQWSEQSGIWPRNRASCFLCPFQPVCSREPAARDTVLNEKFEGGLHWNPKTRSLERTGTPTPSTSKPMTPIEPSLTSIPQSTKTTAFTETADMSSTTETSGT